MEKLFPTQFKDGELLEAEPRRRPSPSIMTQEKIVEMLAAYMMTYYSRFGPNQLPYNPLYDGIPLSESLASKYILEPNKSQAMLTHVPAHEVHEWLKKILAKRAQLVNARTGKKGYGTNIDDLVVQFSR
jgi:hypothetical protein